MSEICDCARIKNNTTLYYEVSIPLLSMSPPDSEGTGSRIRGRMTIWPYTPLSKKVCSQLKLGRAWLHSQVQQYRFLSSLRKQITLRSLLTSHQRGSPNTLRVDPHDIENPSLKDGTQDGERQILQHKQSCAKRKGHAVNLKKCYFNQC